MKKLIYILCISLFSLLYANVIKTDNARLAWVKQQVSAISQPRVGVSSRYIDILKNPFLFTYKVKKIIKVGNHIYIVRTHSRRFRTLKLLLIINHQALINGRWYKLHDKLRGFKISSINKNQVILKNRHHTKILSTQKDNKNIKINIK